MPCYYYEIGELYSGTGTAQANAGNKKQVDGSGTSFDTEVVAGYLITINSETRVVESVTNATTLVVTVAFSASVALAAYTLVNLVNVEDLTVPVFSPKGTFVPFSQYLTLGNGLVRGLGWATARWLWGFLSNTQRDQLRLFCDDGSGNPLASNSVYIRTRNNEQTDAFAYYKANMVWPQEEEKQAAKRLTFAIDFQNLVEIVVS